MAQPGRQCFVYGPGKLRIVVDPKVAPEGMGEMIRHARHASDILQRKYTLTSDEPWSITLTFGDIS